MAEAFKFFLNPMRSIFQRPPDKTLTAATSSTGDDPFEAKRPEMSGKQRENSKVVGVPNASARELRVQKIQLAIERLHGKIDSLDPKVQKHLRTLAKKKNVNAIEPKSELKITGGKSTKTSTTTSERKESKKSTKEPASAEKNVNVQPEGLPVSGETKPGFDNWFVQFQKKPGDFISKDLVKVITISPGSEYVGIKSDFSAQFYVLHGTVAFHKSNDEADASDYIANLKLHTRHDIFSVEPGEFYSIANSHQEVAVILWNEK